VDWTPGDISSDIEDRRDNSGSGGGGFSGGGIGLVGIVLLLVLSLVTGHNFLGSLLSGSPQSQPQSYDATGQHPTSPRPHPAGEDEDVHLISFVLNDAQQTWTQIFADAGKPYRHAKLVLYRRSTYSGCGTAQATTGPFYCPQDEKIYIDLSFWDELKRFGGDTTAFAQAYVITHELGHHIQKLLGIEGREARLAEQDPEARNPLSVDLELQADCFAGIWASSAQNRGIVTPSDIPAALSAAAAVGDDHLQQMSGRAVSPESWTHGSSAQREHWFRAGLTGGTIHSCTTFHGSLAP
jgi:predicted metalloprotease